MFDKWLPVSNRGNVHDDKNQLPTFTWRVPLASGHVDVPISLVMSRCHLVATDVAASDVLFIAARALSL